MNREEAEKWVMTGQIELVNDIVGEPPEAEAEAVPGATLYTRLPTSLKEQIESKAKDAGLSVNAWMIRCAERCCAAQKSPAEA